MKKNLLPVIFVLISFSGLFSSALFAQPWMEAPYLSASAVQKIQQGQSPYFSDIEAAFNTYWQGKTITRGCGYKPFKRWLENNRHRLMPDGTLPTAAFLQSVNPFQASFKSGSPAPNTLTANWTALGPSQTPLPSAAAPRGFGVGRMNCITFHPNDTNIIWAGSPGGGLWKSINGGQAWTALGDNFANMGVSDITIAPSNPNIIYLATGDCDGTNTYSFGVLKSIDGGNTWVNQATFFQNSYQKIFRIIINPANPDIVLMATSWGIYKSTDGGVNWGLKNGNAPGSCQDIKFKEGDPSVVYATRWGQGFIKSTDGGETFTAVTSGLPTSGYARSILAVTPSNPNLVYIVFTDNQQGFYGLYKSTDSGNNWSFVCNSPNMLGGQGWFDLAFAVSPLDQNELFLGGPGLYKSTNGGISFTSCPGQYGGTATYDKTIHGDHHMFKFLTSGSFYSANDGGIHKSIDHGATWENLNNGIANTQMYRIGDFEHDPNLIITGLQDNGAYKLNNTNSNYWKIAMISDGMECFFDHNDSNVIYFSWQNGGLLKSIDGGNNFSVITPQNVNGQGTWITPYLIHPTNSNTLYCGYHDVYKSTNAGSSWNKISNNLTGGSNLDYIDVDNTGNIIYAATTKKIWKTTNGGLSWSEITGTLPTTSYWVYMTRIYSNPSNPNSVWVTIGGYTQGEKVYYSSNGGATWANISGSLPNIPILCIVLDLNNPDQRVYLGTDLGVYYRDNITNDWVAFNNGLPNVNVSDLEINYKAGKLRAGTFGRGLWETPIPTSVTPPYSLPCQTTINYPEINHGAYTWWHYSSQNSTENAEYYTPDGSYTHIMGTSIEFSQAATSNPATSKVTLKMWKNDGPNGMPGTVLAQKDVLISQIIADVANNQKTTVYFTNPVAVTSPYYLGFSAAYVSGDTIGVKSTWYNDVPVNTGFVKNNNVWTSYGQLWGGGQKFSMAAYRIFGGVPNADFTVNSATACPGTTLNFTNTTANGNSYSWIFTGGTPNDSVYALNPSVTYNTAGTYSVKLVAYGSCNGVDSITKVNYITIGNPGLSSSVTNVSCNGNNNGAVDLSVTGTGTYTYLWSNGATTQDLGNLAPGNYTVTVSFSGCSSTHSVSVTQPAVLSAASASANANCNGSNTGSVDLSVTGGTTPYSYAWSNNATTQDISGLTAATYTVTVTDAKGCTATHSKTITQPSALTASASATNASCGNNNGAVNLAVSGGTTPYTFMWSNNATTEDISGLGAGTFTVTVTDNKGCSKTAAATVTSPGSPTASVTSVTHVSCNGSNNGAIDISPSGGATPYTYNWSNGATTQDISGLAAGTYTVTVTDAASCSYNASVNITQPATMTVSVSNQTSVSCNGGNNGSVSISITGGTTPFTYSWSNGATTKDIVSLTAGTYTVTATSSGGCTATVSATISQPPALASSVKTITSVSCNGGNNGAIDINVSGGSSPLTYTWSNNATTQDITSLSAGTYSVTVTDKNGCTSALSANVSQPLVLTATISKTNVNCYAGNNGSVSLAVNGGSSPYSYSWNTGAITQNISALPANAYAVTVTDNKGCTAFQSTNINEPDSISITVVSSSNASCAGGSNGSVNISVSGGITPYSYSWSNGAATEDINGLSAGNYTVTVTAPAGCVKTKQITISEPAAIAVTQNSATNVTCNGSNNGAIDINISGGTSPYTHSWSNGATTQDVSGLSANSYSVTVTGIGGCSSSFTKTITQPSAIATTTSVTNATCGANNGAVDLSVSGGISPYSYNWNTGATSQDLSSLAAGNYTVTVTDANNCTITKAAIVTQPSALSVAVTSVTNISCNGASSGAVNITPSGGSTPYTFIWSNGMNTEDISSLDAGNYTVTVTDASSCSYITSANVNQPAILAATIAGQLNVSCNGGNNGSVDLSVSGGTSPFSYNWSSGAAVQDPTGLSAGTYSVTVTGTGGCTATVSATITEPAAISVSPAITHVSCNGQNNGAVNITVAGGNSPYSFAWSNNTTAEDLNSISAGNYIVTVTDAAGCTKNTNVTVTQPAILNAVVSNVVDANCAFNGGGSVDITVSGGVAPYSFNWSNSFTTEDLQNIASGTYSVTVTDTIGCTGTASATVTQPPSANITINNQKDVSCNGGNNGNIDINVTGGIPPYSYNWSNNETTQDISGLSAGNYTVNVSSGGGCVKTLSIIVMEPQALSSSEAAINNACNGFSNGAINLTVTGGVTPYSYLWSNGSTTEDISGLTAGTYMVSVKDANNCALNDTSVISQPAAIAVTEVSTSATCGSSNGSVNISVSGGVSPYTFSWSNGASSEDISNIAAGNYTVTVTDANNCNKVHTASVTQPGTLSASVVKTDISCNGSSNGAMNLTPSGGTSPYSYSWSNGAATEDLSGLSAGNYTVTITDNSGCSYITSASISDPAVLSSNTTVTNVSCYGGSSGAVNLMVSGGISPFSYSWSNGAISASLSGLNAGTYNVTITDANGCTSQNSATVNQPAPFAASVISQINVSCFGGNNGSVNLSVSGGATPFTYSWSNGSSAEDPLNLVAGTYSVTVTSAAGCNASANATITQPPAVSVSIKTQTNVACSGGNNGALDINVAGGTSPYTFQWSNGSTTEDITGLNSGTYSITATDIKGCTGILSATITQSGSISISSLNTNITCNGGNNGAMDITVTGGATPFSYLWSNAATSASLSGLAAGTYTVTVTDASSCSNTYSASLTEPNAVAVSFNSQENVACNGGSNGSASLTVSGGASPYSYSWSNGSTTLTASGLSAGTFSVTVTDSAGCTGTGNVTITEPAGLSVTVISVTNNSACGANDGAIDVSVSGGVTAYTYGWTNGASTEDISALAAGTYTVSVTDANGCSDTVSATITQPGTLSVSLNALTNSSCNGSADGAVDISVSGGSTPYSFNWSSGASSEDIFSAAAGTYSVTVSDAASCNTVQGFVIDEPMALSSQISVTTAISCNSGSDGSLSVSASGGTTAYSYLWSNGQATASANGLSAGTYSVTTTDANSCASVASFVLAEPAAFSASVISKTDVSCNGGNNGAVNISVSGGTSPFSYTWSNSASTEDISGVTAAAYGVTVTDAAGCTASASAVVAEPAALSIASSVTDVTTNGGNDGAINLTVSGGTSPYSFMWGNNASTEDIANLSAGAYSVTVTDALSCSDTVVISVSQPAATAYCTGTVNLTAVADTFDDGSGSSAYGTNADCFWLIQPANTDYIILSFIDFRTELNGDFVKIYDGSTTSDSLIASYSGSNIPYAVQSTGGAMLVHFSSNNAVNDSGWTASYNAVPLPMAFCSGTTNLTAASGTFSDGSGAANYNDYSNCKWLIQPSGATSITLGFTAFSTEQDYDLVTIYDGADTVANILALFSGSNIPDSVTSSGGSMLVHFTSDYSVNDAGWDAYYNSSNLPSFSCSGTDTLTASSGSFGDGSGAANYGPNSDCRWLIQPAGVTSITLSFSNFDVESGYDFVYVYDGATTSDSLLGAFTGSSLPADVTSTGGNMLVRFSSDNSVQQTGWFASYSSANAPVSAYCSGTTNLTAASGSFSDGSAAGDYVENSNCSWLIQPGGATYITLSFSSFGIEDGYDYVYVYDGTDSNGTLIAAFTGNNIPAPVTVVGSSMFVMFSSDYIVNDAGWEADYTSGTGTPSYCTGTVTLTADAGTFNDGSGPNDYLDNADCYWLIQPPGASSITLDFTSFATESDYDSVMVYDGATTADPLLLTWWGNTLPPQVTSSGGAMLVQFMSDVSTVDSGWTASYSSAIPATVYCSGTTTLTAASDTFSDGSGTEDYLENTNCKWLIQPAGANTITLYFTSFDVESGYDLVYVYDGADTLSPLLGTYTGSALPASVSSSGSSMMVQFMSDYVVNGPGWEAYYDTTYTPPVVYCSGTTNLTAASDCFSDGSGTSDYLENSDCKWLIQPAGATSITLSFSSFNTENGWDSLYVYDGATASDPLIAAFTGNSLPADVTSSGGSMLIHFVSDYLYNEGGWDACYTSDTTSSSCNISLSATGMDATCNGCSDGEASVTATGGTTPYTYNWSNGGTLSVISGLAAGTYSVTVTDANSCFATTPVTIAEPGSTAFDTLNYPLTGTPQCSYSNGNNSYGDLSKANYFSSYGSNDQIEGVLMDFCFATNTSGTGTATVAIWDNSGTGGNPGSAPIATQTINISDVITDITNTQSTYVSFSTPVLITGPFYAGVILPDVTGDTVILVSNSNGDTIPGIAWEQWSDSTWYSFVDSWGTNVALAVFPVVSEAQISCSLAVSVTGTDASCNGCSDGSANLTAAGALGPVTYLWSNAATTEDLSGLSAGTYYVTATDSASCSAVDSVTISEPAACSISVSITGTDATCTGCSDGSADLTVTGASGPVTYLWSNAAITEDVSGLTAGTYYVTATDSAGCSVIDSVTLGEPGACSISVSIAGTDATCTGCSDGSADLIVTGASGPVTYLWSNAATTEDLSGLSAGIYYVTATDSAGCSVSDSVTIGEPGGCTLSITLTGTNVSCNGGNDGAATSNVSGGSSPYDYLWSNGEITMDINGVVAGTYSLTVTDSAGCLAADTVIISQPAALSASIAGTDASCNGCTDGAADLTVSGGTSPYSYLWSNSATSEDLSNLAAGSYSVDVTDANGCLQMATVVISEPAAAYCSGTTSLTTPTGSFSDGSGANDYMGNSDCKWLIQPSGALTITLTFSAFATEAGYDSVTVYDGATTADPVLGSFSGTSVPSPVASTGGAMLVHFTSDSIINDAGWDASYTITTDIIEPDGQVAISIYPNPNQGLFTYSFKTSNAVEFKADIVNVLGEVVWMDSPKQVKGIYSKEADMVNIPAGVYFLNITVDGKSYITRIVRE